MTSPTEKEEIIFLSIGACSEVILASENAASDGVGAAFGEVLTLSEICF